MPVVNVRLAPGASDAQKKEIQQGITSLIEKVLNKDPNWIYVSVAEEPLSDLMKIIQKHKK